MFDVNMRQCDLIEIFLYLLIQDKEHMHVWLCANVYIKVPFPFSSLLIPSLDLTHSRTRTINYAYRGYVNSSLQSLMMGKLKTIQLHCNIAHL